MKKSLFAFLFILFLAISLLGCKDEKTTNTTITTNEATSTTVNRYTVKWMNGEKLLLEESYNEGDIPNYKGTTPTKASTSQYEYTFDGWVGTIAPVTSDTSYYRAFDKITLPSLNDITIKNAQGKTNIHRNLIDPNGNSINSEKVPSKCPLKMNLLNGMRIPVWKEEPICLLLSSSAE